METLRSIIDFLESYPLWAKLAATAGVATTVLTLIFSPRAKAGSGATARAEARILLPGPVTGCLRAFPS